jgi:hypothetical protein
VSGVEGGAALTPQRKIMEACGAEGTAIAAAARRRGDRIMDGPSIGGETGAAAPAAAQPSRGPRRIGHPGTGSRSAGFGDALLQGLGEPGWVGGSILHRPNLSHTSRRAAVFVAKILEGARPAELPVEQPTKFDLVVKLPTAKALGLTIPQSLLLRADAVIR